MVFSPPSIVKDLAISQSAALLLDDDPNETITPENLDNSTSSQVQFNLIQFNDDSNGTKLNCNYQSSLNYHQKMTLLHNHHKLYNENVVTACKTLRNQKQHFVPLTQNRLAIRCDLDQENQIYNPYANENDHDTKFQLSKSIQYQNELNQNHGHIEIPLVRRFGQDRTNFFNILPKVDSMNKRSSVDNEKNNSPSNLHTINHQQFNCFSLKDRISISSHYSKNETTQTHHTLPSNENSQSNDDSQSTFTMNTNSNENLTFKNYDLNDEFWLNFDQ